MKLFSEINRTIQANLNNDYDDNYDFYRFGKRVKNKDGLKSKFIKSWSARFKQLLCYATGETMSMRALRTSTIAPYLDRLAHLYDRLGNNKSRELLVQIIAYRVLGRRKVKLPLSKPEYWENLKEMERNADYTDSITTNFQDWKLYRQSLQPFGYPIDIYINAVGAYNDFVLRQYEYRWEKGVIGVSPGDVVVDAGACWGDTALLFAHETGPTGKVYSFEFLPSNLKILQKNLSLNPDLSSRVTVVAHPIWSESGKIVYYTENGPGSAVQLEQQNGDLGRVDAISIDDFVRDNGIGKIDFIKMDIEGAEPHALRGAIATIRKNRPKLAIAVYHHLSHFVEIPEFLDSLALGYSFYIGHYSIHSEETVLFALAHGT